MAKGLKVVGWVNVNGGKVDFTNRFKIQQFIESLPPGTKVWLEMKEDDADKITSHRGYYFGVVVIHVVTALRDVSGYPVDPTNKNDMDDCHEWLKKEFLNNAKTVKNRDGEEMTLPVSTKRLDDQGWIDYLNKIIAFAGEIWGYTIPRKLPKYFIPEAKDESLN